MHMTKRHITMKNEIWFISWKHSSGEIYGKMKRQREKTRRNYFHNFHESKTFAKCKQSHKNKNWVKQWRKKSTKVTQIRKMFDMYLASRYSKLKCTKTLTQIPQIQILISLRIEVQHFPDLKCWCVHCTLHCTLYAPVGEHYYYYLRESKVWKNFVYENVGIHDPWRKTNISKCDKFDFNWLKQYVGSGIVSIMGMSKTV